MPFPVSIQSISIDHILQTLTQLFSLPPAQIDYQANVDLADACKKAGVKKLVVVSALLTNGAKLGQFLNPAFIFLNIFGESNCL